MTDRVGAHGHVGASLHSWFPASTLFLVSEGFPYILVSSKVYFNILSNIILVIILKYYLLVYTENELNLSNDRDT